MGIGKNATVNFSGRTWENDPLALITDDTNGGSGVTGEGGWLRFLSPGYRQQVYGAYNAAIRTGPSFSRIKIDNEEGVELVNGSLKARTEISFSRGHFYLHDYVLVLGNNDPGRLTGYDSSRYFITGNRPDKGLLLRENIRPADGLISFPLGSRPGAYTPAAIKNEAGAGDDFFVTVFDSARTSGSSGPSMVESSVNKTWQAGKRWHPGSGEARLVLQHLQNDEGAVFAANRLRSYIAMYRNSGWDTSYPQQPPAAGYLTTGAMLGNSGLNERLLSSLLAESSFFTKLTGDGLLAPVTRLWFNAYRLDTGRVRVYWHTSPEINVRSFTIERMLSTESSFSAVGFVASQAVNGYSLQQLNYEAVDPNNDRGIGFYRLRLTGYDNQFYFSDTVAVGGRPGSYSILLWPNPSTGAFRVSIPRALPAKTLVVWNAAGQLVRQEEINDRTIIPLQLKIQGTYFVGIFLRDGTRAEIKKIVIAGSP